MLTSEGSKKRNFILSILTSGKNNAMSDEEALEAIEVINDIANTVGFIGQNLSQDADKNEQRKHKYDVWIAKEAKKDRDILNKKTDIRLIIDWAMNERIDLLSYDFNRAMEMQDRWHQDILENLSIKQIEHPEVDLGRVVFRFSDKEHFLYLLKAEDLDFEGFKMGHCVSGPHYKTKINNKTSIIISLRDSKNEPHVTIEIDVNSGRVSQQYGKGNKEPVAKYIALIKEFVLYSAFYPDLQDKEVLKFLNLHLI